MCFTQTDESGKDMKENMNVQGFQYLVELRLFSSSLSFAQKSSGLLKFWGGKHLDSAEIERQWEFNSSKDCRSTKLGSMTITGTKYSLPEAATKVDMQ